MRTSRSAKTATVVVVLLVFAGSVTFLLFRTGVLSLGESPRDWPVPDPDISQTEERVKEYIGHARQVVVDHPESAQAWGNYGIALDAHLLNNLACEAYGRARQLDPEKFDWTYHYAVTRYFQSAPPEETIGLLQEAMRLKPDYAPGYVRIGDIQVGRGAMEEARASYEKAIELDPEMAVARRSMGQVLLALGEVDDAVSHLEAANRLKADDRAVVSALAQGYMRLGLKERADEQARRVAGLNLQIGLIDPIRSAVDDKGVSSRLCDERAKRRIAEKRFQEAIDDLLIVEEKFPDDAMTQFRLGACYQEVGQMEPAVTHLTRALELDDDLLDAHLLLGKIFWGRDAARVIHHYRRVSELSGPNADLHATLAIVLGMTGALDEAEAEALKAIELDAEHENANLILGQIYEQRDQIEKAIEHYRRAARANPSSPAAARLMELTAKKE